MTSSQFKRQYNKPQNILTFTMTCGEKGPLDVDVVPFCETSVEAKYEPAFELARRTITNTEIKSLTLIDIAHDLYTSI